MSAITRIETDMQAGFCKNEVFSRRMGQEMEEKFDEILENQERLSKRVGAIERRVRAMDEKVQRMYEEVVNESEGLDEIGKGEADEAAREKEGLEKEIEETEIGGIENGEEKEGSARGPEVTENADMD